MSEFKLRDLQLVAERIRRMLKQGGISSETFTRDVTMLVQLIDNIEAIIVKENGE